MNEQVICNKSAVCDASGRCNHSTEHESESDDCNMFCDTIGEYAKCIPVPAQPQQQSVPTEGLLTDEETFNLGFKTSYRAESTELFAYSEGVQDGMKAQLAKVSASFSAQLAEALKAQKAHILAEVDKAGLTDEQLYHLEQDYGWGKDTEERGFILSVADIVAAAQLENIKKQVMK